MVTTSLTVKIPPATGKALVEAYRKVPVKILEGGEVYVDVRKYYQNDEKYWSASMVKKHNDALDKFREAAKKDLGGEASWADRAFYWGKATPTEISDTLFRAQKLGLVEKTQYALQSYCDEFGGIDCSGFVASFKRDDAHTRVNNRPASHYKKGVERERIEDFKKFDVIVWANKHVALIDSIWSLRWSPDSDGYIYVYAMVAESTSDALERNGGVQYSNYHFRAKAETKGFQKRVAIGASEYLRSGVSSRDTTGKTSVEWEFKRGKAKFVPASGRISVHALS